MQHHMTLTLDMQKRIQQTADHYIAKAATLYAIRMECPKIVYDLKGRAAGRARLSNWVMQLNPVLAVENFDQFVAQTVPHEIAHFVDYKLRGRSNHDVAWKQIMVAFGVNPKQYHSYDVTNSSRGRAFHIWQCKDCSNKMRLGPTQHNNMMTGVRRYRNRDCPRGHTYTFVETVAPKNQIMKVAVERNLTTFKPGLNSVSPGSKLQACRAIFQANARHFSRADMIAAFVDQAGCTMAGAATYYQKLKSERAG